MKTESETRRVLLISNSTLYGSGYLDHAENEIRDFLGNVGRVLFVPYALYDRDAYSSMARERLKTMGYELDSIHTLSDARKAVDDAEATSLAAAIPFAF
jgi:dipeptidase E